MDIPNPRATAREWRKLRKIEKARDEYSYDLLIFEKRYTPYSNIEKYTLLFAVIFAFGSMALASFLRMAWIANVGFVGLLLALVGPFFMEYYETYVLGGYTSLTNHIIPKEGDDKHPVICLIHGAWFGSPIENDEELIQFLDEKKYHLTHAFTSKENGEAKAAFERAKTYSEDSRIYPVYVKNNTLPAFFLSLPDKPEAVLSPKPDYVPLTTGTGYLRHAELYSVESKPIRTSRNIEGHIVDVEIPLFIPFVTQQAIEHWLEESEWFIPTPILEEIIKYTKRLDDKRQNASEFLKLTEQIEDLQRTNKSLLKNRRVSEHGDDFQREWMGAEVAGWKESASFRDVVIFLAGFIVCYILLGVM